MRRYCIVSLWVLPSLIAQPAAPKKAQPVQAQSASTVSYTSGKDGEEVVEIVNVAYDVTGDSLPGQQGKRLLLRRTERSRQILGDKGVEGTVTLEAWPLGADLKRPPLYSVKVPAIEAHTVEGELWLVDRALDPDTSWWSVYKVGTGQHLFDTYVELLRLTVSRENGNPRYAGLEIPPDDAADSRLKEPHVVGVVSYASGERVIREAIITCSDAKRAQDLRSYADTVHVASLVESAGGDRILRFLYRDPYPATPHDTVVTIPVVKDDLDLAHAQAPAGIRVAPWRR